MKYCFYWIGCLCFLLIRVSVAAVPEVRFVGYTEGCKGDFKGSLQGNRSFKFPASQSGSHLDSIDWTSCEFDKIDRSTHPYLRVQGRNQFSSDSGNGFLTSFLHVAALHTGHFGPGMSFPWASIGASGGMSVSLELNPESTFESDQRYTFLFKPELFSLKKQDAVDPVFEGPWIDIFSSGPFMKISTSLSSQIKRKKLATIQASAFYDHRGKGLGNFTRSLDLHYTVLSPKYCKPQERVLDPTTISSHSGPIAFMKAVVCMELIPSSRTKGLLSWSERKTQIFPRLKSMERFLTAPASLYRIGNTTEAFQALLIKLVKHKLKSFYQWAHHNFHVDLTMNAHRARDMSRMLVGLSEYSYKNLLTTFKKSIDDMQAREEIIEKIIKTNLEMRELSEDPKFMSFLEEIEFLISTPKLLDEKMLNQLNDEIVELSERFKNEASELLYERDEYAKKM